MNGPGAAPFDLLNCPLDRTNLIEASAGTGKTYALSGLYLRLLLERDLKVPEILVVTFTEAATEELKGRIREKLSQALTRAEGGSAAEPFVEQLIARQNRPERTVYLLQRALRSFDEAAITTIHGFCHRLLREHAFDSAGPFELEIVPDESVLLKTLVEDFWRLQLTRLPAGFVRFLTGGKNPVPELLGLAAHFVARPGIDWVPQPTARCCRDQEQEVLAGYRKLSRLWPTEAESIAKVLQNPKVFNQSSYKASSVADWLRDLADWLRPGALPAGAAADQAEAEAHDRLIAAAARALPKKFGKFAASAVRSGVKKGQTPPEHHLFNLCEQVQSDHQALRDCYETQRLALISDLFRSLDSRLKAQKLVSGARSYGDLLTDVRDALTGSGADQLAEAVRTRYRAALIDEFQDTDPIQYAIFNRLFRTADHSLFLIGDPKQAIYAFRGADIFAYLEAAATADRKFYLSENWRSDPALIQACNELFQANRAPFILPEIQFQPVRPAPKQERPALTLDGRPITALELWWVDPKALANGKLNKPTADAAIRQATAADIARFVGLGRERRLCLGESPVSERDLAVLVRTNAQAVALQEALNRLQIPTVLYQTGDLFAAREAREMQRLLAGILEPGNETSVRTALAGQVIGCDAACINRLETDAEAWDQWLTRFSSYQDRWRRRGFMPMFQALLSDLRVLPRLMRRPDGERMVTNLLHLAEVLHSEAQGRGWGPAQLVKWLAERVNGTADSQEEHLLRMETDESAVRIITMHKSKGLEFPLVYCPYCWSNAHRPTDSAPVLCHDPERDRRLLLDLGSPDRSRHADLAFAEDLAECLRLLYVAVTRARHRCVLVWGRLPKSALSALAYLLHGPFRTGTGSAVTPQPGPDLERLAGELAEAMGHWSPEDLLDQTQDLERRSQGALQVRDLPTTAGAPPPTPSQPQPSLQGRRFSGRIDRGWRLASFSGLVSERLQDPETADRDQMPPQRPAEAAAGGPAPTTTGLPPAAAATLAPGDFSAAVPTPDILSFPRGARAGTVLHAIFEELDFQSDPADAGRRVTATVLGRYGFDPIWEQPVLAMVQRVLTTPLMAARPNFTLDSIAHGERISELEFHFPLGRLDAPSLNRFLAAYQPTPLLHQPPARIGRLSFSPTRGFMKGFIDLVFRFDGRFYLLDWKSNHLGDRPDDYRGEALASAMAEHFYTLQYLIYTAALDRYLALRFPGYSYDTHFGGVFYVFLRGVDPELGPDYGIYHDRPESERVRDLQRLLQAAAEDDGR